MFRAAFDAFGNFQNLARNQLRHRTCKLRKFNRFFDFRFRFENPESRILPGMFVRGSIEIGRIQAILVPQMAATRGRDGTLSAWVAEDGKAVRRTLTEEGVHENAWIVTGGLNPGERLIVNGTTGLAQGAEIAPTAVEIDENGVVRDLPPDGTDPAPATPADAGTN